MMTFDELRCKEIISIKTGEKIGYADDLLIDEACAQICSLIVRGRYRFFGLFGKEEDVIIKWCEIEKIGEDTILVCTDYCRNKGLRKRRRDGIWKISS